MQRVSIDCAVVEMDEFADIAAGVWAFAEELLGAGICGLAVT